MTDPKAPPAARAEDGRDPLRRDGFLYLPRFFSAGEAEELIAFLAALHPLWERRHGGDAESNARHGGRLTRPVYWLGAWQFACLGYYAEPHHREHRCVRAEPFPPILRSLLERTQEHVGGPDAPLPNTCLINYYGRDVGGSQPVDFARLRMHQDGEPGPVVMFAVGQPGLLEFVDPSAPTMPELGLWTRHRSLTVLSQGEYKDRLYHRISAVRSGLEPKVVGRVPDFETRRISISFRHVPEDLICNAADLPAERGELVRPYLEALAEHSPHFQNQLKQTKASG